MRHPNVVRLNKKKLNKQEDKPVTDKRMTSEASIILYSVLACALTWIIVLPLVLSAQGLWNVKAPFALHYLAPYGPFLGAFITSWMEKGGEGVKGLINKYIATIKPIWLLVALSPWLFYLIASIVVLVLGQNFPSLASFGYIQYGKGSLHLPFIGAWLLWILTFGLGEETGWRGFMLPRLQRKYTALTSALILGLVWCLWHIPAFLYNPNFQAFDTIGVIMWAVGVMFGSVFLTWLYNSSGGSLILVALWHGTFNTFSAAAGQATSTVSALITMMIMASTLIIARKYKSQNLSDKEKQTA